MRHSKPILYLGISRPLILLTLVLLLSISVAGCGQPGPTSTEAMLPSTPTPTQLPTATPTTEKPPTATPIPTPTTEISPLATPTPTATTETSPLARPTLPTASAEALAFDGDSAYDFVLAQCDLGPRPTGSEAGWATGDYIIAQLEGMGWQVVVHEFTYQDVPGRNIVGKRVPKSMAGAEAVPAVMLGAHYDTRPYADHNPEGQRDEWILGANDGGSGVAVLLELARILEVEKTGREIWLAFFDAEDRGNLDGWPFSVGAAALAQDLVQASLPELAQTPELVIVVDMVGDADQQLHYEGASDTRLNERIWTLAQSLGYESFFIPTVKHSLVDDHLPFLEAGIPTIDMIDFDYPYWHTTQDTADKVAPTSLERVGKVLELFLESGSIWQP